VAFGFMFNVFRWDVVISFCWYWWSCWQSLFKLSLQNFDTQESTMTMFLTCLHTFQHLNTIHLKKIVYSIPSHLSKKIKWFPYISLLYVAFIDIQKIFNKLEKSIIQIWCDLFTFYGIYI
jgi:hypothetical protein